MSSVTQEQIFEFREVLRTKKGIDWLDCFCDFLRVGEISSVQSIEYLIGTEDTKISPPNRGSKFLLPFDGRFKMAAVSPDLPLNSHEEPITFFSIGGSDFKLDFDDLKSRFPSFTIQSNNYDGGCQIFFYPVSTTFGFTALSFDLRLECEDVTLDGLVLTQPSFHFGKDIILGRAGYFAR